MAIAIHGFMDAEDPRLHWEHDGNLVEVAKHMRECGHAWEPGVRLIGNCRACDIAQIAENFIADQELIAGLQNGDRVILPKTIEHARAMCLVAFNAL